ncbi:hypothetical protein F5Y12DRAFT_502632 [Xylaria sp. FL1777]|nr:hypothetical protein F5Y12DRAFT_502632 [Xylaria sp. FL1777]
MAPTLAPELLISCHCGVAKQTVRLRDHFSNAPQKVSLCHCSACRHNTGLLCVSYAGIDQPDSVEGLVEYRHTAEAITRFFCATCGCHVFRRITCPVTDTTNTGASDSALPTAEKKESWAVPTGVIIGLKGGSEELSEGGHEALIRYAKHINTSSTKDGGLSPFIRHVGDSRELEVVDNWPPLASPPLTLAKEKLANLDLNVEVKASSGDNSQKQKGEEILNAFCHCKTVQFHITRPNAMSKLPRSNFPDLMVPFHTGSPQVKNPEDDKWWLRPGLDSHYEGPDVPSIENGGLRRYMAGTCACLPCRLISGFEIQTWAFIPKANIFFHIRDHTDSSGSEPRAANDTQNIVPLDFATLPANILTSYESSPGVRREFCSCCGATVFWRDRWRPELMDVSVGLLDAYEGARAETWLDWWTGRVSFAEDAGNGRTGDMARIAKALIDSLGTGLRKWGEQEEEAA